MTADPELITLEDSSTDDECKPTLTATPSVPADRAQIQRRGLFRRPSQGQEDDDIQEIFDHYDIPKTPYGQGASKAKSSSKKKTLQPEVKLNKYMDPNYVLDISKKYLEARRAIERNITIDKTRKEYFG